MRAVVTEIRTVETMAAIRADWDALLSRCLGYGFAQTPIYAEVAAATVLRRGQAVYLIAVHADGQLRGLWPVSIRASLFKELRPLSCGSFEEYSGPLLDDEYAAEASAALLDAASRLPAQILRVQSIASTTPFAEALAALEAPGRHVGNIDGFSASLHRFATWEEYAAQVSKSYLADLRRRMRRLRELGPVEMGWCKTPREAETIIRWIWEKKRAWAKKRRIDTPYIWSDDAMQFFIELARRVDLSTLPLVCFLKLDGAPVAGEINLVGGRAVESFFAAFDEAFARFAPGKLLIEDRFRWAIAHGLDFDFRILAAEYKAALSDTVTAYTTTDIYLTPRGAAWAPHFRTARQVARSALRAPGKAFSLLSRPAGPQR